jgi:hypothetical protein
MLPRREVDAMKTTRIAQLLAIALLAAAGCGATVHSSLASNANLGSTGPSRS